MHDYEEKLKGDFRVFLFAIWKHLNLPDPTPVQYDIADYLQSDNKRIIIEAFRGIGKSWITAAFVLWTLYKNPLWKIMVVSASKERADSFSTFTRRLIEEVPFLTDLKPRRGQRDSKISFDVAPATPDQSPSVKSVGITGQLTGSRADIIVADDIEVLNNSATHGAREKLSELIKEFDAILKPVAHAKVIYLGTPQTEMSLYNVLPERGYKMRIWPAEYPEDSVRYRGRLAPWIMKQIEEGKAIAGDPVDPKRFTSYELAERRASYGKAGYALQFLIDTSMADLEKYPLKLNDLLVMSLDMNKAPTEFVWSNEPDKACQTLPTMGLTNDKFYRPLWYSDELKAYTGKLLTIDPSGRGKDETGWAVTYFLNGYVFVMAAGGCKDGYDDGVLKLLASIAKKWAVNEVLIESNFGDGMYKELLKPHLTRIHPVTISEVRHHTQKEKRVIDALEPAMMQHRLIINESVIQQDYETSQDDPSYSLFYQMTRISYDRGSLAHDDRLEAVYMGVNYWVESMGVDVKNEAEKYRQELLVTELKSFEDNVFGGKAKSAVSALMGW